MSNSRTQSTIITLTLPDSENETRDGTILVQRGDLARIHQFTYGHIGDLSEIIAKALVAMSAVEADPPAVTEILPPLSAPKKVAKPVASEPTVDVPLKKGTKAVRISRIKIIAGETDAAAYRQAALLAGKLIDGKLWDGETPIRFDDVYRVAKKMKFLTDRDFSLFKLEDFVQTGDADEPQPSESIALL